MCGDLAGNWTSSAAEGRGVDPRRDRVSNVFWDVSGCSIHLALTTAVFREPSSKRKNKGEYMKKLALAFALGLSALMCGSAQAAAVAQPWAAGQGYNGSTLLPSTFNHNAADAYNGQSTSASLDIVINPGGS